jgi:hypothetical protein
VDKSNPKQSLTKKSDDIVDDYSIESGTFIEDKYEDDFF